MIPVIAYWYNDLEQLPCKLPLSTVGAHAAIHGFMDVPIHLLCLRGPQLPDSVRREWEGYGFELHDGRALYEKRAAEFAPLKELCPRMYFDCFLRWLVMGDYYNGQSFLSLDADIFLNVKISELVTHLEGSTGTATSTCFAPISNTDWLRIYETELRRFMQDRSGYLRSMRSEMPGLIESGSPQRERETIIGTQVAAALGTDQSFAAHFDTTCEELFVDYLVRSRRLPQDALQSQLPALIVPQMLVLPDLAWVTPLPEPARYRLETPMRLTRQRGTYALNGEPLAFIHFQGACSRLFAAKLLLHHFFQGVSDSPRIKSDLHPGELPAPDTFMFINAYRRILEKNPRDPHLLRYNATHPSPFNETQLTRKIMIDLSLNEIFNPVLSDWPNRWAPAEALN